MNILVKSTSTLAAIALMTSMTAATIVPAQAGSQVCGNYVLGGAFKNRNSAQRRANKVGGYVWDLDLSNSPNAGKGYWVVGDGPFSVGKAKQMVKKWKRSGAPDAYRKNMCFTGV